MQSFDGKSITPSIVPISAHKPTVSFFLRRREIVQVVRDHPGVSFDFLSRRFIGIPTRTLHFDIAQLIRSGQLKKLGVTRGVVYITSDTEL